MTKEECIALLIRYAEYDGMGIPNLDGCREAMRMAAKLLSQPALPSNLDEATEEYAYNNWEDNDYHIGASEGLPFDAIGHTEKCFKAGAEWMSKQGVTKDAVIGMATKDIFINVSGRTLDELDLCTGDKVVVQIRKK